ncbi:CHAT domain-containing protein [Sorangium sp. So ce381]|uniref:CHAT domain-containing protein n=1 Tax=Sorangium sp. So ce381 TaxID=3133307 RepID=UPI003F5AFDED
MLLSNLGAWLIERHHRTGSLDDLRDATAACRLAVGSADTGSPGWARSLIRLGSSLDCWYGQTRRLEDLEEAVSVYRKAVDVFQPANPSMHSPDQDGLFASLYGLAGDLHERFVRTGSREDLSEAAAASRQALELGRARSPGFALGSAELLGLCSLKRSAWREAASAYAEAMAIVDTLCEAQLLRSDKQSYLRSAPALYAGAAYSLARMGDFQGAVLALETGRARVLTEMLDRSRTDLEAVEERAPELAHRYRQMLAQLRQLEAVAANGVVAHPLGESEHGRSVREQVRVARADLRGVMEAIRSIPGNESFLAHPSAASLAAALEPGVPVVYLAATDVGGIALVVSSASGAMEVTPLWLDSMTTDEVNRIVQGAQGQLPPESWLGAYREQLLRPDDREARARWHESITRTTRTLWDLAMGPVVALLTERFSGSARAALIPNGLLSLLPLHAAWTGEAGDPPRCALDEVSFSYAPSIRALAHARDVAGACGQTRLLVVDDPRPTSAVPLQNSRHEVEAAAAQFAVEDVTRMVGEECRRDEVLAAIARAHVCHFSCHGMNNWNEPLQSGLLMANDEVLTVEALFALPGQRARLAVLSACETGIVGTGVPNEVVALPSAFLQAGFAGVVASLWPVYDISASLLMGRFYELWRSERLAPAVALRRAQIWLRDLTNRELAAYLERLVPELAPRMSRETAEALHLRALLQDPETLSFADPVHWAAFYVTGI